MNKSYKDVTTIDKDICNDILKKFHNNNIKSDSLNNSPVKSQFRLDMHQRREDFVYLPHRACLAM